MWGLVSISHRAGPLGVLLAEVSPIREVLLLGGALPEEALLLGGALPAQKDPLRHPKVAALAVKL